jgi:molybdenum cofactor cytidylyltransferase
MSLRPTVIVLAAGRGSRFAGERHKLTQDIGEGSVLVATLKNVLASQLPVLVVTTEGLAATARDLVAARDVVVLPEVGSADDGQLGMGYSIAAGVRTRAAAPAWLVLPGDMPLVQPDTLLAVARGLSQLPVAYAQYRGRRGHPVAFAAELFSELANLSGDEGARRIIARYPAQAVDVDDPGVLVDVDTVEDLHLLRAQREEQQRLRA